MTSIELDHIGTRYYVSIIGHANFSENGKDIVCAGVSTLALSFIYAAEELGLEFVAKTVTEGVIVLIIDSKDKDFLSAFKMLSIGLKAIADTYPKYVSYVG